MTRNEKLKAALEIYSEWRDSHEKYYIQFGLWLQMELDKETDDESDTLWD